MRVERTKEGEPTGVFVYDNILSEKMRENGLPVPAVSAILMVWWRWSPSARFSYRWQDNSIPDFRQWL